jgi:hypothetical protein
MAIANFFPGAVSSHSNPPGRFKEVVVKIPVSWLYEAIENELQGSGMTILKNSNRALKETDFE